MSQYLPVRGGLCLPSSSSPPHQLQHRQTGHQEHPGTGRKLDHEPTGKIVIEDLARSLGIRRVHVIEPRFGTDDFERLLADCLESKELAVIITRRPCILIAKQIKQYEAQQCECEAGKAAAPVAP